MIPKNKYRYHIRFLITGAVNTLFSYVVFFIVYYLIQQKEMAVTLTLIIAVLFNYQTISKYVFSDSNERKIKIFIAVYLFIYILDLVHLWITVDIYHMNVYWASLLTLFYLPLISFYLNKRFVYGL